MGTLLLPIPTSRATLATSFPKCPCAITIMPLSHLPLPTKPLPLSQTIISASQRFRNGRRSAAAAAGKEGDDEAGDTPLVEPLRVPEQWLHPSQALQAQITSLLSSSRIIKTHSGYIVHGVIQESEWLRVSLHKWLDDEYCPEPTNIEISKVAALSYYESLVEKHADLGEILLKMARDLESISYKESFHGAFSSANAAVSLIAQRLASIDDKN